MSAPKLKHVLDDAEIDLKNAELKGVVGKIFNPVFDIVLAPATAMASDILPGVAGAVPLPFVDEVSSVLLGVGFGAVKLGYSISPLSVDPNLDNETDSLQHDDFERNVKIRKANVAPNPLLSSLMGVVGFATNSAFDLLRLPFSSDLREWINTSSKFVGYLACTGVGDELLKAFMSPGVVDAMMIIARAQEGKNSGLESRRIRTAMDSLPEGISRKSHFKVIMKKAATYARYSSAAYGVSMIDSAELLQGFGQTVSVPIIQSVSEDKRKRKMSRYLDVKVEDIIAPTSLGGDIDIAGHFIAIDRKHSKVVLTVRGTYTISGLKSDAAAYSRPFCNGVAHAGIADRTDKIWEHVKDEIVKQLKLNPGFEFVITGHSLGAGIAVLLTLKIKHELILASLEPTLASVHVSCFAFASPPVYMCDAGKEDVMAAAMKDTYAFIHENDVVPFCSVNAIRRISHTIDAVDGATNMIDGPLMAIGRYDIPKRINELVFEEIDLPFVYGGEKLSIPAPFVTWMRKFDEDMDSRPMYNAMFCRPASCVNSENEGINDMSIMIDINMIGHHMNPQYERAINSIVDQMEGTDGVNGYVLFPSFK